jgi:TPR repeat protein
MTAAGDHRLDPQPSGRDWARAKLKRIVLVGACALCAGLGVFWIKGQAGEARPAALALDHSPALGAGSALAFPFGRGDSAAAGHDTATTGWAQFPFAAPDLPDAILAMRGEPASDALDRLGALARRGDARAAFDAYEIADFCTTPDLYRSALLALAVGANGGVREKLDSGAKENAGICLGTTPAQLNERFANIRIAAQGGVKGAAEKLLDAGLPGQLAYADTFDPTILEWAQLTVGLVLRDATGGDVGALTALASLYQSGEVVARDPTQALTYQLAAAELMKAQAQQYSPGELALQQEFISGFESQVAGDQLDAARKAALDLVARCCSDKK